MFGSWLVGGYASGILRDSRPHYLSDADLGGCRDRRLEKVTIRELLRERIAGSCFAWICDIYFPLVSRGPPESEFSAPTQALAARAGSLNSID
jgi:hypothetical protein